MDPFGIAQIADARRRSGGAIDWHQSRSLSEHGPTSPRKEEPAMSPVRPSSPISNTARILRGDARARVSRIAGCLLAVMAATACATQTSDEPAGAPPTMDTVFSQVLEPRCTFSSCHSAPTVAAKLDLSRERACSALVGATSCLFPQRKLVIPSSPDDSFLMHKLTGAGLSESPDGNCSAESNAPMPFGGSTIPDEEIALVREWIAAGAPCESSPTGPGPGAPPGARLIASLTVDRPALLAGEIVTVTVTLDGFAPDGGQPIDLETDSRALSAPVQVYVPAGKSQVTFEAYAQRPTPLFALVAHSGDSAKTTFQRVTTGLEVAEVLSNSGHGDSQWVKLRNRTSLPIDLTGYRLQAGLSSYGLVTVPLTGTLAPGSCLLLGEVTGPTPSGAVTYQPVDFSPNLPTGGSQAAGYAVFDSGAASFNGIHPPLDTVLVGAGNAARLLGDDGQTAAPACATPSAGYSARRTGPTTCVASVPQPTQCP
jgi:hypothetical protein